MGKSDVDLLDRWKEGFLANALAWNESASSVVGDGSLDGHWLYCLSSSGSCLDWDGLDRWSCLHWCKFLNSGLRLLHVHKVAVLLDSIPALLDSLCDSGHGAGNFLVSNSASLIDDDVEDVRFCVRDSEDLLVGVAILALNSQLLPVLLVEALGCNRLNWLSGNKGWKWLLSLWADIAIAIAAIERLITSDALAVIVECVRKCSDAAAIVRWSGVLLG